MYSLSTVEFFQNFEFLVTNEKNFLKKYFFSKNYPPYKKLIFILFLLKIQNFEKIQLFINCALELAANCLACFLTL